MTRHKFGAKPTTVDGIRFHSQGEAKRYQELRLLEKAGEIESLELQPAFVLHAPLTTGTLLGAARATIGKLPKIGTYRGDFRYLDCRRGWIVEDFKGYDTPMSKWKRKHCEAQYGISITVVTR